MVVLHKSDVRTISSIKKFKVKILYQNHQGYGDAWLKGLRIVKQNCSVYLMLTDPLR